MSDVAEGGEDKPSKNVVTGGETPCGFGSTSTQLKDFWRSTSASHEPEPKAPGCSSHYRPRVAKELEYDEEGHGPTSRRLTDLRLDDAGSSCRLCQNGQPGSEAVQAVAHPKRQVWPLPLQDVEEGVEPFFQTR